MKKKTEKNKKEVKEGKKKKKLFGKRKEKYWREMLPMLNRIRQSGAEERKSLLGNGDAKLMTCIQECLYNVLFNYKATSDEQKSYVQKYLSNHQCECTKLVFLSPKNKTVRDTCVKLNSCLKVLFDIIIPNMEHNM